MYRGYTFFPRSSIRRCKTKDGRSSASVQQTANKKKTRVHAPGICGEVDNTHTPLYGRQPNSHHLAVLHHSNIHPNSKVLVLLEPLLELTLLLCALRLHPLCLHELLLRLSIK